jgi:hypothetical protein
MLVKCLGSLDEKYGFESCLPPKPHLVVVRIFSFLRISNDEPVPIVVYYSLSLEPYHLLI